MFNPVIVDQDALEVLDGIAKQQAEIEAKMRRMAARLVGWPEGEDKTHLVVAVLPDKVMAFDKRTHTIEGDKVIRIPVNEVVEGEIVG